MKDSAAHVFQKTVTNLNRHSTPDLQTHTNCKHVVFVVAVSLVAHLIKRSGGGGRRAKGARYFKPCFARLGSILVNLGAFVFAPPPPRHRQHQCHMMYTHTQREGRRQKVCDTFTQEGRGHILVAARAAVCFSGHASYRMGMMRSTRHCISLF